MRFWHRGELLPIQPELSAAMKSNLARIEEQAAEIDAKTSEIDRLRATMRQTIELLARQRGRQDILARLASTSDVMQFQRWLSELLS